MENKQHTQVPNNMAKDNLEPKDQLIYAIIHSHLNSETKACFPSLQTLSKESGASINTIRASIARLKEAGYIKTEIHGRQTYYTFSSYIKFEPFSMDFLKNKNLNFTTKAYVVATQQYMYKDVEGLGKISFSNRDLSDTINMPQATINDCNQRLKQQHLLHTVKNERQDAETGLRTETKIFELSKMGQDIIWKLKDHEERIAKNTSDIKQNSDEISAMKDEIKALKKTNAVLIKVLNENSSTPIEYNF